MNIRGIVVIYKKTNYEIRALERKEPHFLHLLQRGHPTVSHSERVHEQHTDTLREVKAILGELGLSYRIYPRYAVTRPIHADLVITVGGDGTFLETAHRVLRPAMLGVNSNPGSSVGHFCTATGATFREKLLQLVKGKAKWKTLQRLQVSIGGKSVGSPVLNDVLFAHQNPAAMSRYILGIQKSRRSKEIVEEEQSGSGLWVATPVGSTAALGSAGGPRLPREAKSFAYQIRELQQLPGRKYRLRRGTLPAGATLLIIPKMEGAHLFIDGAHESHPVPRGYKVAICLSDHPLKVVG